MTSERGAAAVTVRDFDERDAGEVGGLLRQAFPAGDEARLVDDLRAGGATVAELVAITDGRVVGYAALSLLAVTPPARVAWALAPLAVAPDLAGRGFGSSLVDAAVNRALAGNADLIVVLGDPAWYAKRGFSAQAAANLRCAYSGPHLMAAVTGRPVPDEGLNLTYPEAFARLG